MFNTFEIDGNSISIGNKIKMHDKYDKEKFGKQQQLQMFNFSAIQLNPWNDQFIKSPTNFEADTLMSFPKQYSKPFSNLTKKLIPYSPIGNHNFNGQTQFSAQKRKSWLDHDIKKREFYFLKRKKIKSLQKNQIKFMNKTISVHTIESDKMFGSIQYISQRKQKFLQKDQKKQKRISNPMYGRFCNNFNIQKINKISRRKQSQVGQSSPLQRFNQTQIDGMRERISTFSLTRGDPERAKSIHEVRRRLKSTSQIMRKREKQSNRDRQQQSLLDQGKTQEQASCKNIKLNIRQNNQFNIFSRQANNSTIQQSKHQNPRFKINRKKNLYIGCRKFCTQISTSIGNKQKQYEIKREIDRKQFVKFQQIKQMGLIKYLDTKSQFQKIQSSFKKIN